MAFSTFVSRAFGEKNYRDMNKVIFSSVVLCGIIGVSFTLVGLLAAKPLLLMLHTPADIFSNAWGYLTTMIAGILIVMGYNMASSILRALGDGKTPLVAMVIAACLNIGLDCLFVFVFHWGIIGAALASLISQLVSFLYCLRSIVRTECVCLDAFSRKPDLQLLGRMLRFGVPVAVQYVVVTMGGIILQSSVNLQGSIFIAGYTATNKLYGFLQCFAMSLGQAVCTFVGQNYGAGLYHRVRRGVTDAAIIVSVMAVLISLAAFLGRWQILRIFLDVQEIGGPQALEFAARYLGIMSMFFVVVYILHVYRNVLQAMGIAIWSLLSGFVEFAARVLMSKVVLGWIGTDALFLAEPASWLGAMLCVTLPYFYYRRKLLVNSAAPRL